MTLAKGCKKPVVPPHLHKPSFRMHAAATDATAVTLPDVVSFEAQKLCPPIKDQGAGKEGTGSCEGHSCSSATEMRCTAIGKPLPFTPSEEDGYKGGRSVERARETPLGTELPKLEDVGAMTEDVISFYGEFGIRPRRVERTADGRNSDCEAATINEDLTLEDLEKDAHRLAVLPPRHAIDPGAPDAITLCRAALAASIPLRVDFFVDSAFEGWTPDQPPVGAPNDNDPNGGGHAVVLVGYKKLPDGHYAFRLHNSWGTEIADAGYWWVSEAWVRRAWGITPWDISIKEVA